MAREKELKKLISHVTPAVRRRGSRRSESLPLDSRLRGNDGVKKIIWALLLGIAVYPAQAKNPMNPHWRSHKKKSAPAAPKIASSQPSFSGNGWDPQVVTAINDLISRKGKGSPGYNPQAPPIATLPWENVFLDGDASELIFWHLVRRVGFKFSDDFWNFVPIAYGRQKTRAAYEQFSPLPKTIWKAQPTYHQYLKYFLKGYQDQCRETGLKSCRIYLAHLWIGFSEKELADTAMLTLNQEKYEKIQDETISEPPEDRAPIKIRRGLRVFPQMLELAQALHQAGFEIWVMSADAVPVLKASLSWAGVPYARAGGIKILHDKKGYFTGKVSQPFPFWGGETEIVFFHAGYAPDLSVGAFPYDREILRYGKGLKILIDTGNQPIKKLAVKRHWLIQPAFTEPATPPIPLAK